MAKLFNRAKMTTSTTGSGTVTLDSASVGYQSFADAGVSNGDVVQYVIEEGGNFEIGTGTYSATGTSLTRSPTESSNANSAISLGGAATVSITAVADDLNRLQHEGSTKVEPSATGATVTGNLAVTGTVDGRDVAADGTKLDGIEANADVTDTANVTAAGALMDSEVTNLAQVKAFDSSDYATAAQGTTADAALPRTGGTMTGNITFNSTQTFDGRDVSADGAKLDNIEAGATADQTITAGSGLTGGGTGDVTISHADTSSQASVNGSGRTYIQDITLDTYGHVTGLATATETVVNTDTVPNNATITISAGNAMSGGGDFTTDQATNETITINHADTSGQASVNNSGRTYIQDITLDTYGHVTGISSATETVTDTARLTTFQLEDGDGTEVTISHGKEVKFVEGGGIDINWTDTSNGTDGDPYDLTFTHADTSTQASVNNSGRTYIQDITLDGYGHVTGISSATETVTDTTYSAGTGVTLSGTTFSIGQAVGTGNSPTFANMYLGDYLYHNGDTNTYIQFSTDVMNFYVGGSREISVNATGVRLGDTGNGYFRPVSGQYGSIEIYAGAHNGWRGYSIDGRVVFMHDNASGTGLYNDVNNEWLFYGVHNSYTRMYYNGAHKLETTNTGVTVVGDLNSTSDIRYKKNIETIDNALEKVQSLRGVTYNWDNDAFKEDDSTKKPNFTERATGVIAQDVEKVLPEAVRENEDGFKNVAYGNMVGLLIEAIKEQQQRIEALEAKLNG